VGVIRRAQPFHGDNLGAFEVGYLGQAGKHRFAVDNNGAGPALALAVAPLFGAGKLQVFPEQVQEHPVLLNDELVLYSIDF